MAKCKDCFHYEACSAFSKIINAAADVETGCEHFKNRTEVVEVVRCKNCKHFDGKRHCWRNYKPGLTGANMVDAEDFCSYGERRAET